MNAREAHNAQKSFNLFENKGFAEGGTRTPTSCLTRPSNVRVYQFRHFGICGKAVHYLLGTASGDDEVVGAVAGAAGVAVGVGVAAGG